MKEEIDESVYWLSCTLCTVENPNEKREVQTG